ncbi:hypothetical protein A2335_03445 [Candidatus Peregrinibacteria bacterium RIFOXYB2_FULL_32_7]|nr:MAG: hypothetical protein A2335_03445 [Candidatus Peregrinibacteria bacterium RIFOXYB2_FULL_32_7]
MLKIPHAVRKIILKNSLLKFGIHHKLLNLAQVAKFIKPLVSAQTKKNVTENAIHMSLSRLQKNLSKLIPDKNNYFEIDNITINSNLCAISFLKTEETHKNINNLYNKIQKEKGYITITEGGSIITIILEEKYLKAVQQTIKQRVKYIYTSLASLGITFPEKYLKMPGLLYLIIQQIALQNINIVELASTTTEFIIYLDQKDVMLAFDTIFQKFSKNQI